MKKYKANVVITLTGCVSNIQAENLTQAVENLQFTTLQDLASNFELNSNDGVNVSVNSCTFDSNRSKIQAEKELQKIFKKADKAAKKTKDQPKKPAAAMQAAIVEKVELTNDLLTVNTTEEPVKEFKLITETKQKTPKSVSIQTEDNSIWGFGL